jgi:hypothetical protein
MNVVKISLAPKASEGRAFLMYCWFSVSEGDTMLGVRPGSVSETDEWWVYGFSNELWCDNQFLALSV